MHRLTEPSLNIDHYKNMNVDKIQKNKVFENKVSYSKMVCHLFYRIYQNCGGPVTVSPVATGTSRAEIVANNLKDIGAYVRLNA